MKEIVDYSGFKILYQS